MLPLLSEMVCSHRKIATGKLCLIFAVSQSEWCVEFNRNAFVIDFQNER